MKNFNQISLIVLVLTFSCSQANFSGGASSANKNTASAEMPTNNDDASKVPTEEPIPQLPGKEPTYDPNTRTFSLTVETSQTKPVTNLYLIVDNSFSMSAIQAKVALAIEKLMKQVEVENLNVNLHLYTTTDFTTQNPSSVVFSDSNVSQSINLSNFGSGMFGAMGNTIFSNRKFFEVVNGARRSISSPEARSGNEFIVSDDVVLGKSKFSTPDGVIRIRETHSSVDVAALIASATANIAALGTAGSDREQAVAAIYRISKAIASQNNERAAFWIVTNEDDATSKSVLTGQETVIGPQTSVTFYGKVNATSISYSYEYLQNAVLVDGVVKQQAKWVSGTLKHTALQCKNNSLCNASNTLGVKAQCTPAQLKFMVDKLALLNTSSARSVASPTCEAVLTATSLGSVVSSKITDTCTSIDPVKNLSYKQILQNSYPNDTFNSAPCYSGGVSKFIVKESTRKSEASGTFNAADIGTLEVGQLAIKNLSRIFGARGYSVALVANNGKDACGQTNYAEATRLQGFMALTPNPDHFVSVCASDYGSITKGLKDFISVVPKTSYKLWVGSTDIQSITVTGKDGSSTVLSHDDYWIKDGVLEFKPGAFKVGDDVSIAVIE